MGALTDPREARLLNEFQRGFPVVHAPYAVIAQRLGVDEGWVRATLASALADGRVSRIGAVFRPGSVGVSTLAALPVPQSQLARVAARVSARQEVNHNYEREHRYNLWFVVTAADQHALADVLDGIADDARSAPISLPLLTEYWIDLGFDLGGGHAGDAIGRPRHGGAGGRRPVPALTDADRRLVDALADGLPPVPAPYAVIADKAGVSEACALARIGDWLELGVVKRLGVVVRHRALGFTANAMCVWDVPDGDADALGAALAREPGVTLCYRRRRALPDWRYNLFCMVHGTDRPTVEARVARLAAANGLNDCPSAVLFSRRAFKQCGARYALTSTAARVAG